MIENVTICNNHIVNLLHELIIMISVTIQQSEICTGSGTQQDNTPFKWAQEKCNLFDTPQEAESVDI